MRSLALLFVVAVGAACSLASGARAEAAVPSADVVATDPSLSGQLGNYESLFVRLSYRSDQPIVLRIEGLSGGQPVPGMSGGERRADAGSGETLLWIAHRPGVSIDGVRIHIFDARHRLMSSRDVPAHLQWTAASARPTNDRPDWVRRMLASEPRPQPSASMTIETLIGGTVMLSVPGYFVLQAWLGFAWTGGWRKSALAPLVLIGPAVAWSSYALAHQSNLWPITVILLAPLGLAYLLVLCAAHALAGGRAA